MEYRNNFEYPREDLRAAIRVGGGDVSFFGNRFGLQDYVSTRFNMKPAVRADIFRQLYLRGQVHEWYDGFGMVVVEDRDGFEVWRNEVLAAQSA